MMTDFSASSVDVPCEEIIELHCYNNKRNLLVYADQKSSIHELELTSVVNNGRNR